MPIASTLGSPRAVKRLQRGPSSDGLLGLPAKRQETQPREEQNPVAAPLLPLAPGETQNAYFARLGSRLTLDIFSSATSFHSDGLYLYKRPVRSAAGDKAALLELGGTCFYHVVVYIKQGEELTALEFGPANAMDITDNMMSEAQPGPVVLRPAPQPEPQHLPMLHIAAPHHCLDDERVQKALKYAEGTMYHALKNNCICFADFVVRVLTGGVVRGAPLVFDHLIGQVPAVTSPLLPLLTMMTQMSWHDVCDGSRLTRAFLQQHPNGMPPPPPGAEGICILRQEDAVEPAVPAAPASCKPTAAPAAPALPASALTALMGLLPPGALTAAPGLAAAATQPTSSTSGSEDTVAGLGAVSSTAASGSASASTCTSRPPLGVRGMALPPRKARK